MASITQINGSDKIKDSRVIINQNLQNLNNDKAEKTEIQSGSLIYNTTTGSGNAYVLALTPAPTSYTAGMTISLKANHTNTGSATINVNGLGAKTIKKNKDYLLEAGDIKAGGVYTIMYDGTDFQMISQLGKKYEAKDLKASPQSPEDLTLYVQAGSVSLGGSVVHFAGGNSPSFPVPTTNPRIDLLVLNSAGVLERIAGTEAASPSPPTYPSDKFVICEVYNRPTQTVIKELDDGVNGYILRDVRAFLGANVEKLGSSVSASDTLRHSNDTERFIEDVGTTYRKIKETKITGETIAGIIRIRFDIRNDVASSGQTMYGRVYLNGVAVGSELGVASSASYVTLTDNIDIIAKPNDLLQIYVRNTHWTLDTYCRNFRIYFTLGKRVIYQIGSVEFLDSTACIKTKIDGVLPSFTNQDP